MMTVSMGEAVPLEYAAMIADQLGFRDQPDLGEADPGSPVNFRAVIIGAGALWYCRCSESTESGHPI